MPHLHFTTRGGAFLLATTLLASLTGCQVPLLKPETMPAFVSKLPFVAKSAPTTLDQVCVARCDRANTHCEQRQQLRETECQQHFKPTSVNQTACIADQRVDCLQPVACLGADLSICKTQYQDCLNTCQRPTTPVPLRDAPAPAKSAPVSPNMPSQATAAVAPH